MKSEFTEEKLLEQVEPDDSYYRDTPGHKIVKNEHPENQEIPMGEFVLKDSGEREEYSTGAKRDSRVGKGRFDLIHFEFLRRLSLVCESGSLKYGDNNYLLGGIKENRFLDSAMRHINNYRSGLRDEDHIVQAAWNLMAIVALDYLVKNGVLSDKDFRD